VWSVRLNKGTREGKEIKALWKKKKRYGEKQTKPKHSKRLLELKRTVSKI